jgi:hypothetical protein
MDRTPSVTNRGAAADAGVGGQEAKTSFFHAHLDL